MIVRSYFLNKNSKQKLPYLPDYKFPFTDVDIYIAEQMKATLIFNLFMKFGRIMF